MDAKVTVETERRQFLKNALTAGALICAGCHQLFASATPEHSQESSVPTNHSNPADGMSADELVRFTLGYCVPTYQFMLKEMGKEKFLKLLKEASTENSKQLIDSMTKDMPDRNLSQLADIFVGYLGTPPYDKIFKAEVVERTDKVFEIKYTECLFAKVYREMNALDIGYTIECGGSDAVAKAYNPKIKVSCGSNMMKGDSHCTERFELNT